MGNKTNNRLTAIAAKSNLKTASVSLAKRFDSFDGIGIGALSDELLSDSYSFSPLKLIQTQSGCYAKWEPRDAVVIKALAQVISAPIEKASMRCCYHIKGHGGLKGALRRLSQEIKGYQFICKTDIESYYFSMDHQVLMAEVEKVIQDKRVLRLIYQILNRVEVFNAEHKLVERGVLKGCPLSHLWASLYLLKLDQAMQDPSIFYLRYMDDFVICAKTRHHLKRAIKKMHKVLKELRLNLARKKTFIGKISRCFNFLGFEFSPIGIGVAQKTEGRRDRKLDQLFEQGASIPRIDQYLKRWTTWVQSGLKGIKLINLRQIKNNNHSILRGLISERLGINLPIPLVH